MYYYITEPTRTREQQQAEEKVRELLIRAGIAGEFVCTSPTRDIEALAEMGVAKKYTTLVGIGSEPHLNMLGTLLAGTPYVFGAIPITREDALASVSGIRTFEEGVEALKFRRVHAIPVCRIEPNKFFFAELHLASQQPVRARLRIDDAFIEAPTQAITFTGSGTISLKQQVTESAGGSVLQRLFLQQSTRTEYSHFHGTAIAIETDPPSTFQLGHEAFVRTPLAASIIPSSLKIITRRDTLSPLSEEQIESHGSAPGR